MIPSPIFLAQYFTGDKTAKKSKYYSDACSLAEEMLIHFDGKEPGKLLTERRPAESKEIQAFRKLIFKSKTKAYCDKIQNALMKIRKSPDWMIKYPTDDKVHMITEDESLQSYMETNFPRYDSFTNWYFQLGFKVFLTDTNAVCLWKPLNEEKRDNEYYKPYPFIFKSHQVIDYQISEWYLLLSEEKNVFVENKQTIEGFIYYYVDDEAIYTIRQINSKGGYEIIEFPHGLSYCPVVDFGGVVQKETTYQTLRHSRIYGIVPSFDEAAREYSDLQAEVIQHIHSTIWAHAGQDCKKCNGTGKVPKKDSAPIDCKACKGKGTVPFDPFQYYEIPRPRAGEPVFSGVPMGYVQKQIDIAELQDKRIRDHIKDGLSAVMMEFLVDPPQLNQSGLAKATDKDDMHTFYHVVAEDVVRFFDKCYSINADLRYAGVIPTKAARMELVPMIPVPEKYDLLSETYLVQELKMLKDAGVTPSIITLAQKEYANKKFFADPLAKSYCDSVLDIDPFTSKSEDDILVQLQNGGIDDLDYAIHCNIESLVTAAAEANKDFFNMKLAERKKIIETLAKAKMPAPSAKIIPIQNAA